MKSGTSRGDRIIFRHLIFWAISTCVLLASAQDTTSSAVQVPIALPSIEDLIADSDIGGMDLSPSGRHLAGIRRMEDRSIVFVIDLQNRQDAPTYIPITDAWVDWIEWANDDRVLFALSTWITPRNNSIVPLEEVEDTPSFRFRRMFAMNRDGSNMLQFFADDRKFKRNFNLSRITDFLPQDPDHILVPAYIRGDMDLFKVDVNSGDYQLVASGGEGTFAWYTDSTGVPAFRLDLNRFGSAVVIRARIDKDNGKYRWRPVKKIKLRGEQDKSAPDFYPLASGPTPNSYYVTARPNDEDKAGIYLYDFIEDKYIETLKIHPKVDVENVLVDAETREFLGTYYYEDRLVIDFVDEELAAHIKALDAYFGEECDVVPIDQDDSGTVWLLYASGANDAGSYHVYDTKIYHAEAMGNRLTGLDRNTLAATQAVRYAARDGVEIMGYLTRPPTAKAGDKPPLIMMPHGGPEVRDTNDFDPLVQLLATRGYQVFQPNFRGSSGFGKAFAEAGYGKWGTAMQHDLTDGHAYLVAEGLADPSNACIIGGSYGGYAALAAATMSPEEYRCVVSIAGISDLLEQLKHDQRTWGEDVWDYLVKQIGHPRKDKDSLAARSPANLAENVTSPILLIHGKNDNVVPFEQSELMVEALQNAGKSYEFLELEEAGHSYRADGERQKELETILAFVQKYLPVSQMQDP